MKCRQPSLTLLAGMLLLILALVAVFFHRGSATDSSEVNNNGGRSKESSVATSEASANLRTLTRPERMSRIEKLISEEFSEEREIDFYDGPGDLSEVYREKGLMGFYGQMRNALRRDEDALAEIFTTYMAGPEAYGGYINLLIEHLGDEFFLQQVQRQPESTQSLILGQIWQTIDRFPLDYRSDGSIPVADSGLYYPKCGELFLVLLEKELQSDYWQRRKKMKSESGPGE